MMSLAVLLKNRGMKQIDLARKIHTDKGTVSRWVKNGVPPERLSAVAEATGIAPHDLRPDLASIFRKKDCGDE